METDRNLRHSLVHLPHGQHTPPSATRAAGAAEAPEATENEKPEPGSQYHTSLCANEVPPYGVAGQQPTAGGWRRHDHGRSSTHEAEQRRGKRRLERTIEHQHGLLPYLSSEARSQAPGGFSAPRPAHRLPFKFNPSPGPKRKPPPLPLASTGSRRGLGGAPPPEELEESEQDKQLLQARLPRVVAEAEPPFLGNEATPSPKRGSSQEQQRWRQWQREQQARLVSLAMGPPDSLPPHAAPASLQQQLSLDRGGGASALQWPRMAAYVEPGSPSWRHVTAATADRCAL